MLYKLSDGILTRAPKSVVIDGTTYINNDEVLKQLGYKELVNDDTTKDGYYVSNTTYTEDNAHIYEHKAWTKYDDTEVTQEPTLEERITETENSITELQAALCDVYESMGGQ